MDWSLSRRGVLHGLAIASGMAAMAAMPGSVVASIRRHQPGWVKGHLTGAEAVVETLQAEGADCVYGIPGAQENELWDVMKSRNLPYLLVTHEFSAACMADGYARSTGKPGVLCVVPGPGVTNSLTGLGEALLDSVPIVAIVGDIAKGENYRPFQVHCLDQVALLKPVTKAVYSVCRVEEIPHAIRQAFAMSQCGEPGPVAVVIPYDLLIEKAKVESPPLAPMGVPFDEVAFQRAVGLLSDPKLRIGIYAGQGCMEFSEELACVADMLQAPVATSVSGKGSMRETHPLAVGWGYGPHATMVAEKVFAGDKLHPLKSGVDCVLAIGVKYSEVSTGFYGNPQTKHVIHVDANANNLGKVMRTDVCVHSDAGVFLSKLRECGQLQRTPDAKLVGRIRELKVDQCKTHSQPVAKSCVDPMSLIVAMRKAMPDDGMLFVDVTVSEHLAAEGYTVCQPRTYFNPTDNQSMGWSIPASIGAAKVHPGRTTATITGDGCFLMSAMEITTAARENIPVKFFVLDDQTYHYMQMLQESAYKRTTATILARMDYASLAKGFGVAYTEIGCNDNLEAAIRGVLCHPGPILVRVITNYGDRKIRWIEAVRDRYIDELSAAQKARFLARVSGRTLNLRAERND